MNAPVAGRVVMAVVLAVSCASRASTERPAPEDRLLRVGGTVLDDEGRPVSGAQIDLVWQGASAPQQRLGRTWTLDDGAYQATGRLPPYVRCSGVQLLMVAPGYRARITRKRTLRCDGSCLRVDFTTEPAEGLWRLRSGEGVTISRCTGG